MGSRITECAYTCLVLVVDDRVNLRPAAKRTLVSCQLVFCVLRCFCRPAWGNSQHSLLRLYHGLTVSRIMCALPLVSIRDPQREVLEVIRGTALGAYRGLPSFSRNLVTHTEAHDAPLWLLVEEYSLKQL